MLTSGSPKRLLVDAKIRSHCAESSAVDFLTDIAPGFLSLLEPNEGGVRTIRATSKPPPNYRVMFSQLSNRLEQGCMWLATHRHTLDGCNDRLPDVLQALTKILEVPTLPGTFGV